MHGLTLPMGGTSTDLDAPVMICAGMPRTTSDGVLVGMVGLDEEDEEGEPGWLQGAETAGSGFTGFDELEYELDDELDSVISQICRMILSSIESVRPSMPDVTWIGATVDQLAGGGHKFASPTSTVNTLMPLTAAAR